MKQDERAVYGLSIESYESVSCLLGLFYFYIPVFVFSPLPASSLTIAYYSIMMKEG